MNLDETNGKLLKIGKTQVVSFVVAVLGRGFSGAGAV